VWYGWWYMKSLLNLKKQAIKLRNQGLSYGEIQKQVNVAKSSLSLWLKDIELSPEHRKRLYTKRMMILNRGPKSQKERRLREVGKIISKAKSEVQLPLSSETFKMMGAALYWAEGRKKGLCEVTNSDPCMIAFMVKWFELMFGVKAQNLKAYLNIYPQQDESKVKEFWSDLTGIPTERFGKSFVKPLSKNYKKNNLYYGTIKVGIPKSVDTKHRIFGWIDAVLSKNKKINVVMQKWESLQKYQRPIPVNLIKNMRP